jgi:hypothetical protein
MLKELQTLFLYCVFNQPEYLKGEISKHLEIPEDEIKITKEKEEVDDNGNPIYSIYTISVEGKKYTTRFDKKVRNIEKVKVPKLVKKEKKWWQDKEDEELEVIVEEKETKKMQYWVLSNIEKC